MYKFIVDATVKIIIGGASMTNASRPATSSNQLMNICP